MCQNISFNPSTMSWSLLPVVKYLMDTVDRCFPSIKVKDTLVSEQKSRPSSLATELNNMVNITIFSAVDMLLLEASEEITSQSVP